MAELKITITPNAAFDEIVDSIVDVFQIGITLENALEDGFQLTDLLAAVGLEPVVREVINDAPVFLEQFKQLNPETAITAVIEARTKTEQKFGPLGKVSGMIFDFLFNTASTYGFLQSTITQGMVQLNNWKALFAKAQA